MISKNKKKESKNTKSVPSSGAEKKIVINLWLHVENNNSWVRGKKRILYIDDEKDFLLLTKIRLEKSGEFEVITTTDPEGGIELAKKHKPDLILLDIIMPGLEGDRVAGILLNDVQTKRIPILFYSDLVNDISAKNGRLRKIGGWDFIPKTAGCQELLSCVRKVLC